MDDPCKIPFPRIFLTALLMAATCWPGHAQVFTLDDTLRGSITPERAWWDLTYYHLDIRVLPESKSVSGNVTVQYKVLEPAQVLQIDLQPPLRVDGASQDGRELNFKKRGKNAYFITVTKPQEKGRTESVIVRYSGTPTEAENPPWQGGFQWTYDRNGLAFIATSCQGLGASAWWPCKDHMYDEPDSMLMSVTVPETVQDVSNGRLREVTANSDSTKTYHWFVTNPINNYGVNVNIADYAHFSDTLHGEKGVLDMDYYVLRYNLEKAKEQFKQAKRTIKAFEYWFGPYPFYEDGFKLVETPYLGMEHQSSVTYGNGFANGYRGRDLSGSGWGMKWDYIIIHETAHEWFANNITYRDIADMWVHESFATYAETLYTEYHFGVEAGNDYNFGIRQNIRNDDPIIGTYDVNKRGSGDMYPKGANMLHTIRHSMDDDEAFRNILRGLNDTFYHQTVTTQQIEDYISNEAGFDYSKVFDQYLRTTRVPAFEYYFEGNTVFYRWSNCVEGFNLPLVLRKDNAHIRIEPTAKWQRRRVSARQKGLLDPSLIKRMYYVTTQISAKDYKP